MRVNWCIGRGRRPRRPVLHKYRTAADGFDAKTDLPLWSMLKNLGRSCFSGFGLFGNFEQLIGSTIQQQAQGLNIFILNGLGLVVHHFVEILITHTELLI